MNFQSIRYGQEGRVVGEQELGLKDRAGWTELK